MTSISIPDEPAAPACFYVVMVQLKSGARWYLHWTGVKEHHADPHFEEATRFTDRAAADEALKVAQSEGASSAWHVEAIPV